MRTLLLTRKQGVTLGLFVLIGGFFADNAWSQGRGRGGDRPDRVGRMRDDTSSLLMSMRKKEVLDQLKLTPEQEKQLGEIRNASFRIPPGTSPEDFEKLRKETDEKAVNVLSAEQKLTWQKIKAEAEAGRQENSRAAGATPDAGRSGSTGGIVRAVNTQTVTPGVITEEKPPEGARAVISFGPLAALRVSQAKAKENPAPAAGPSTAANTGFGNARMASIQLCRPSMLCA